jgi:plastocyanin
MTLARCLAGAAAIAGLVGLAACKGGSGGMGPSSPPAGGANTIAISASGASPRSLTVSRGTQVTFVNNDSRSHSMNSDPHPTHGDCPEIDQVGFLSPGQSKQTGNLNTVRTCGYHDHDNPGNTSLQGTITIQ